MTAQPKSTTATATATVERGAGTDAAEVPTTSRPMRADAKRNYELLVTAARKVFDQEGGGASMEAIAKEAGVGVGTLYRHFPNRLDLVEAVYETDVEELRDTAQRVSAELQPWPAVEAFFEAFLRYARTKQALMAELRQAFEKNPDLRSRARGLLESSFDLVIDRAKDSGAVRPDVDGADVMALVAPVCTNGSIEPEQANRLLRMILDGMRAESARPVPA
jgi:AcrR family transcriptional regulator